MAIDDESPPLRVNTTRGGAMVTSFFFFFALLPSFWGGVLCFLRCSCWMDGWMD
jgi:hypothetical protein